MKADLKAEVEEVRRINQRLHGWGHEYARVTYLRHLLDGGEVRYFFFSLAWARPPAAMPKTEAIVSASTS